MKTIYKTVDEYNHNQNTNIKDICIFLNECINKFLKKNESKIWHGSPVWFLEGNPIVAYSVRKSKKEGEKVSLMFFSGQSFQEEKLKAEGKFKAAEIFYTNVNDIKTNDLRKWLKKSTEIQWDYKNIIKRKGILVRLK
jgi:hypothetical protein